MSKTSCTINNIKEMLDNVSGLYLDDDIEKLEKYVRAFCNKAEEEGNFLQVFDRENTPKEDKKIDKLYHWFSIDKNDSETMIREEINTNFQNITEKIDEIIDRLNGKDNE